jgi:hypothetical protein
VTEVRRDTRRPVQVSDSNAPAGRRSLGTFQTERTALDAERPASLGIAPSAQAETIRDWPMMWLPDTDGGALFQRRYEHPSERGMRKQVHLGFTECAAERLQRGRRSPANRRVSQ